MKRKLAMLPLLFILAACGGNSSESSGASSTAATDTTSTASSASDLSSNPDYQKGLALASKSNCFTCHKVDTKLIGPAYKDVAKKYAGNDTAITYLAHKIINGGSGVWGSVAMTPHPELSEADAEQIVKYILLLK
jgi:cytochrome c